MVDKAFASVARSVQSGAQHGLNSIASMPGRVLSACATFLFAVVTFPYRMAEKVISAVDRAEHTLVSAVSSLVRSIVALPGALMHGALSLLESCGRSLSRGASNTVARVTDAVSHSFVGSITRSLSKANSFVFSSLSNAKGAVVRAVSASVDMTSSALSRVSGAISGIMSVGSSSFDGIIAGGSQMLSSVATSLNGLGSQCSTFVGSSMSALATAGGSLRSSSRVIAAGLGREVASAGARVSSSVAAFASWCVSFFRDRKGNSGTATSMP